MCCVKNKHVCCDVSRGKWKRRGIAAGELHTRFVGTILGEKRLLTWHAFWFKPLVVLYYCLKATC